MSLNQVGDNTEKLKGWSEYNNFAETASWSVWDNLMDADSEVPESFRRIHLQLAARTKVALIHIGKGAHHVEVLGHAIGLMAHSTAFHVGCLEAKGLVWTYRSPEAPEALQGRLHFLTNLGEDYFHWLTGEASAPSEFERLNDQTQNRAYLRNEGAYIDAAMYCCSRRSTPAWIKPCRFVDGAKRKARVHPDVCVHLNMSFDRRLDVQIELGTKRWRDQIRQVALGTTKSLCTVGRCDVFVLGKGVATRLANTLKARTKTLIPAGAAIQAPGEVRIFPIEKLLAPGSWPYSNDGAMMTLKLAADGTVTECHTLPIRVAVPKRDWKPKMLMKHMVAKEAA